MCLQVGPETVAGYSVMVLDAAMGALHLPQNPWADVVDFSSSTYSVWSQPSDGEFFGFSVWEGSLVTVVVHSFGWPKLRFFELFGAKRVGYRSALGL